jgi:hypothetical protein
MSKRGWKVYAAFIGIVLVILYLGYTAGGIPKVIDQKANPTTAITEQQPQSKTVYITNSGKKYHSLGCMYLKKSQISISLDDAIGKGYEPCSKCNP